MHIPVLPPAVPVNLGQVPNSPRHQPHLATFQRFTFNRACSASPSPISHIRAVGASSHTLQRCETDPLYFPEIRRS